MNADDEHPEPESTEDETLARRNRFAEVLDRKRQMDWSDWTLFIYYSKCLTPDGQRVALRAVDTLQQALKGDFLQQVASWLARMQANGDPDLAPDLHPIFSFGLWPANDVPWVYANLIQLAAHIQLFNLNLPHNRFGRVLKMLHDNPEPINWVSALLQLEVAGLGLRAGWQVQFEPKHRTDKKSDVLLTNGPARLLVETTTMRMSVMERKALAFFRRLLGRLRNLEWQYDVRISGSLGSASLENAEDKVQWLQDIEEAAGLTAQDGLSRQVPGPEEALLTVFRSTEATAGEPWKVVGDPVEARILDRLIALLRYKNMKAQGSVTPVWVRLDEFAGLWQFTRFQGMTLAQTLSFFTNVLQEALASFPHLAGVILSPGVLWIGNTPPDSLVEWVEHNGSIALRCPIPVHRARETIIVPRAGASDTDTKVFADWYANEDTWLDWALEQLQYPLFNAFIHEPLGGSDL
jgi:hypothetical protein